MSDITLFTHLLWQRGVPEFYLNAACAGIEQVIQTTMLWDELHGAGFFGTDESRWNQSLLARADRVVRHATESAAIQQLGYMQLDIRAALHELGQEWQRSSHQNEMPFLIVHQDYGAAPNGHREPFVVSGCHPPAAATISTFQFQQNGVQQRIKLFRLMAAREFARLMGAPNEARATMLAAGKGTHQLHCTNRHCIMQHRPNLAVYEHDLLPLYGKAMLCDRCCEDIRSCVQEMINS